MYPRLAFALALACCTLAVHAVAAPSRAPAGKPATRAGPTARAGKSTTTGKSAKATRPKRSAKARAKARPKLSARTQSHERTDPWRLEHPTDPTTTPAYRYGLLGQDECEAELTARQIPFTRETARGVVAPVRLGGRLHGVEFRSNQSARARATSVWEIADCRLVLALDDFAELLAAHDIVEVRHYSMYRPPDAAWPADQPAKRHPGALAIDAARFIASDGSVLDVDDDFNGAIDAKTCGDGAAPAPATPAAVELRAILCEAVERRLFNVVLTPNYNPPHKNHFHLEVTAGVKWFLVH